MYSTNGTPYIFPLYLYSETSVQQTTEETNQRTLNLKPELIKKIAKKLGLKFTDEKEDRPDTFAPIDLLDYIYAILYSPTYRETYQEFLKIDFPHVPYPEPETFWSLVKLGGQLRELHLLEGTQFEELNTCYSTTVNLADNIITRKMSKNDFEITDKQLGRVWINDYQYFDNVPTLAWEFYIGGYQPAQKWLKDRYSRQLNYDDVLHYQKIIKALTETHRLMQEIDEVLKQEES